MPGRRIRANANRPLADGTEVGSMRDLEETLVPPQSAGRSERGETSGPMALVRPAGS
jgi:hypothetical protein